MKVLLAIAALCFLSVAAATAPLLHIDSSTVVPDQYMVVLHTDISEEIRDSHIDELTLSLSGKERVFNRFHIGRVIGFSAVLSKETLVQQLEHPNVRYIEADQTVQAVDTATTQQGSTWGISRICRRDLPFGTNYTHWGSAGQGVTAYVIDTGILITHNEFAGGRAVHGITTTGESNNSDQNGHGTHVASTIGGAVYGVAKNVQLVAAKVLNSGGSGTWAGVMEGVNWVAKNHTSRGTGALSVANMSLGGAATQTLDDAIRACIDAGVHMVLAAGNDNGNACNYSPARVTEACTVGATNNADQRASFSNYGKCVDVFGPGQSITAASISSNSAVTALSGTSMAAPHVAGVFAVRLGHLKATGAVNPPPTTDQLNAWVASVATPNKISNPGAESPNKLLYSPFA